MSAAPAVPTSSGEAVPLEEVIATHRLVSRPLRKANRRAERTAFRELTEILPEGRASILRRLATLGLKLCGAGTAGVSMLEDGPTGEVFRWHVLAGELAEHEGGTTPRNWSPCGSCLDAGKPVLYSQPARRFTYFNQIDTPIIEGLVIPIYEDGRATGTIWIVSHEEECTFDAEDLRIMVSLGRFAGASLHVPNSPLPARLTLCTPGQDRESDWKNYLYLIARNDQTALNALLREARPLIFSTALRILSFAADADEVTGDVFARLWNSAYLYEADRGSAIGWLVSVTRNLSFDRLRSHSRERDEHTPEGLRRECSIPPDAEGSSVLAEQGAFLRKALEVLSFDQRQAVELAYLTGLSHAEIAKHLGEPLGTVKTRIRMGLIRLRSLLAAVQ